MRQRVHRRTLNIGARHGGLGHLESNQTVGDAGTTRKSPQQSDVDADALEQGHHGRAHVLQRVGRRDEEIALFGAELVAEQRWSRGLPLALRSRGAAWRRGVGPPPRRTASMVADTVRR